MHFPENMVQIKKARERLDFDEVFLLQLEVLDSRKNLREKKAIAIPFNEELIKKFVQGVGFDLTSAQRRSAWEIILDCAKSEPMNRLLQGDVGSGKTVVAALAMANVAANSAQSVLLCPTEILAKQHYDKISKMLEPLNITCALLTGNIPKTEKEVLLTRIHEGEIFVLIGTHAVLNKEIKFWRLGLAIIDEQHRFGVEQRSALRRESGEIGTLPHFLSMTATPIPRTLTLTVFGDLDVSILNEMPPGRQKIVTRVVPEEKRQASHKFIKDEIKNGGQVYIVCPLVEEKDEENERKSVMGEYEKYKTKIFPDIETGFIYGGMKSGEKEKAMADFALGKTKILVASSVIEVGMDVHDASIIIIEDADRFGLAQLHQFRGRVGRGERQSYCFLFTTTKSEIALKRLCSLVKIDDGFELAEADLEIRGPGELLGIHQHGLLGIKSKNLMNAELIKKCRLAAIKFLENNNLNEYPLLKEKTKNFDFILNLE
jgi:ATP-dependent DNA helicase RecG